MNNADSPTPEAQPTLPKADRKPWDVPLGQIVATRNAHEQLSPNVILRALARHSCGDWGDVGPEDWEENEISMQDGFRLLSSYRSPDGVKFWIITEWDRSVTTVLLPDDY